MSTEMTPEQVAAAMIRTGDVQAMRNTLGVAMQRYPLLFDEHVGGGERPGSHGERGLILGGLDLDDLEGGVKRLAAQAPEEFSECARKAAR
jgi:hypothetical protein